jgi:hypothetical protein
MAGVVHSERSTPFERLEPRQLFSSATELLDDIDGDKPSQPPSVQRAAPLPMPTPSPQPASVTQATGTATPSSVSSGSAQFPNRFVSISDAPRARFEGYNFVLHGLLWCTGGFDADFRTVPGVDIYNPRTGKWASRQNARLKCAETHAGVAIDGKFVYFAGGYIGDLLDGKKQPVSSSVWRWEPVGDTWKKMANLPSGRGGGALVKVDRELHFFGGCLADRVSNSSSHWMLPLGPTTSAVDDGTHWIQRRAMPKARDHLSGVGLNGKVYAIGGEYGHDVRSLQTGYVHCFDPKTNLWTKLADLPIYKSHAEAGTSVFEGKIIIGGGQVQGRGATGDVEQYDPVANKWVGVKSLPEPRQGAAVQRLGNQIVVALGAKLTTEPMRDVWVGRVRTGSTSSSTSSATSTSTSAANPDSSTQSSSTEAKLLQMQLAVADRNATMTMKGPDGKPTPMRCTCPLCSGRWSATSATAS